ncbi:MAG: methyltransferase [Nostoc sp. LLA-1]|nr:methyltransferase [Cyanocohniella sp. LLY]
MYVQYGCGMSAPKEWMNFDVSPNLVLERLPILGLFYVGKKATYEGLVRKRFPENVHYGDIVKGLPVHSDSCSGVYAAHVLEHLSLYDFKTALKNTFSILKKDGVFRFIVPDLEVLVHQYIESQDPISAIKFIEATLMGTITKDKGLKSLIKAVLGNSNHLWMWDFNSLKYELETVGFVNVRKATYHDSHDMMFRFVEHEEAFVDALCVECYKPQHM